MASAAVWGQCEVKLIDKKDVSCFGGNDGQIIVEATGDNLPFAFFISPIVGTQSSAGTFDELLPGIYTITAFDYKDTECTSTPTPLLVTIDQPSTLDPGIINISEVTYCEGYNIDIGGTSPPYAPASGGTLPYTYTWQRSNGCSGSWIDIEDSNNPRYNPDLQLFETTCFIRRVEDACGQIKYSEIKRINIVPDPSVSITGGGSFCVGVSVELTPSVSNGTGTFTYKWYQGLTLVSEDFTYYPPTSDAGTFNFHVVAESNIPSCNQAVRYVEVIVNELPTATISGDATICNGASTTLSVELTGTAPWNMTYSDGTSTNTVPGILSSPYTFDVSPVGTKTYTITDVSDANGCNNTGTGSALITVNLLIPVNVSIAASATTICEGTPVTFTATSTNGGTTPSYQWYIGSTSVGDNSHIFTPSTLANGNQVRVEMTSSTTCPVPSPALSNTITITVNPEVVPSISIEASETEFCEGNTVVFTAATPTNGGLNPIYQWFIDTAPVGSNSNTYSSSTLANGQIVTVQLTSSAVCADPQTVTSNPIQVTVNPNLPVSVTVEASANPVCAGTSVTFTATPTNGGDTPAYQWYLNGSPVGTNSPTHSYTPITGDQVYVILTSNAVPCASGNPASSNTVTLTVDPILPVSVAVAPSANPVCEGTSVTFT
jgi:hypothetical protein